MVEIKCLFYSLSFEEDDIVPSELRNIERPINLERSLSLSTSDSVNESYSSGYSSYNARIAPQFLLPLLDQTVPVGGKCVLSVLCMYLAIYC